MFFFTDNFIDKKGLLFKSKFPLEKTQSLLVFEKDNYIFNFQNSMLLLSDDLKTDTQLIEAKLEEILLYLWKKNPESISSIFQKILAQDKAQNFKDFIKQHELNNLTLDELAFLSNMSLSSCKRKFNETYQTSPKKYFIKKKMKKARIELQKNRRPSDIFHELGYENLSAFSNEFKKQFGLSPKNYSSQFEPKE